MEKVVQTGLPVWRFYTGLQLIHPQLTAMGYAWRRGHHVEAIARAYGIELTSAYIGSPIQEVREQGRPVRYRLDKITDKNHPLLQELKADGGTDYFAASMSIARNGPLPVVSFATDRRGGFSDLDIEDLTRLVDMIGAIMEMHIEHGVADTVTSTYLGRQISERVLKGAIRSKVNDGPEKVYRAGENFAEMPGDRHAVSANASTTEPASLLAVFVVDTDEKVLTTPIR